MNSYKGIPHADELEVVEILKEITSYRLMSFKVFKYMLNIF